MYATYITDGLRSETRRTIKIHTDEYSTFTVACSRSVHTEIARLLTLEGICFLFSDVSRKFPCLSLECRTRVECSNIRACTTAFMLHVQAVRSPFGIIPFKIRYNANNRAEGSHTANEDGQKSSSSGLNWGRNVVKIVSPWDKIFISPFQPVTGHWDIIKPYNYVQLSSYRAIDLLGAKYTLIWMWRQTEGPTNTNTSASRGLIPSGTQSIAL